jgi:diguanylate cyclase (GGDEF)-like protein
MVSNKARWGIFFCIAAIVLLGGLYYLLYTVPAGVNPGLYQKAVPTIGLLFSCFVLFFGHISYPRLHSVKVYFSGYGAGGAAIFFFTLCKPFYGVSALPPLPHGFIEFLIVVSSVNLIAVCFLPADTKYRVIRSVTLSVMVAETVLLLILRFSPTAADWLRPFAFTSLKNGTFWILPAFLPITILLSVWKIRREFFFGGIVAGAFIMLTTAWTARAFDPTHAELMRLLVLAALPVYLSLCMAVHGFFRMEHRIAFDPLLKIYNRDYCSRIITEQASLNVAPPFGIAMVDIDHFKQVNDTYGHQAGDAVLHAVAQAVQHAAGPDGIACRYGGEELVVFFPQRTAKEIGEIAEQMRKTIEKTKTHFGRKTIQVTVSVGVSHREQYNQSIVDVIQSADKALYTAKKEGRNQVRSQKTAVKTKDKKQG